MNKLDHLYELAFHNRIDIHWVNLKEIGVLGLNVEKKGLPHMIFLDPSIKNNTTTHTEILAHEIGHYFTTVGNFISNKNTYRDKLATGKCENKADKWACEFLVSEKEIINLVNSNITCVYEMADILEVSIDLLSKRLKYLSYTKQMLELGNNRFLILTNLPNFYIYEDVF